jgi:hypothetical protein
MPGERHSSLPLHQDKVGYLHLQEGLAHNPHAEVTHPRFGAFMSGWHSPHVASGFRKTQPLIWRLSRRRRWLKEQGKGGSFPSPRPFSSKGLIPTPAHPVEPGIQKRFPMQAKKPGERHSSCPCTKKKWLPAPAGGAYPRPARSPQIHKKPTADLTIEPPRAVEGWQRTRQR